MRFFHLLGASIVIAACLLAPDSRQAWAQAGPGFTLTAEMRISTRHLSSMDVQLLCSFGENPTRNFSMSPDETLEFSLGGVDSPNSSCQLRALPPEGYSAAYVVEGDGAWRTDKNGCQFARIAEGQVNTCWIGIEQDPVELVVYKEWIGGSGEEEDVRVSLECESGVYSGFRYINERSPNGWEISDIDPEGILCNVMEAVRETYRPDIIDCQGLLVRPGKGEECTMINTKIVKRIEMLNRYGKVVMILLVLAIGLAAVRRLG